MASMLLRASRYAARAAPSAASGASRCAAAVASGSGGLCRLPIASRTVGRGLSSGRDDFPIGPPPEWNQPESGRLKFVADAKDLESDEALWALYERWCEAFGQKRDKDEMRRRFNEFKQTVLLVDRTNKEAVRDGRSVRLWISEFADGKRWELMAPKVPIFPSYDEKKRLPARSRTRGAVESFVEAYPTRIHETYRSRKA